MININNPLMNGLYTDGFYRGGPDLGFFSIVKDSHSICITPGYTEWIETCNYSPQVRDRSKNTREGTPVKIIRFEKIGVVQSVIQQKPLEAIMKLHPSGTHLTIENTSLASKKFRLKDSMITDEKNIKTTGVIDQYIYDDTSNVINDFLGDYFKLSSNEGEKARWDGISCGVFDTPTEFCQKISRAHVTGHPNFLDVEKIRRIHFYCHITYICQLLFLKAIDQNESFLLLDARFNPIYEETRYSKIFNSFSLHCFGINDVKNAYAMTFDQWLDKEKFLYKRSLVSSDKEIILEEFVGEVENWSRGELGPDLEFMYIIKDDPFGEDGRKEHSIVFFSRSMMEPSEEKSLCLLKHRSVVKVCAEARTEVVTSNHVFRTYLLKSFIWRKAHDCRRRYIPF